jgi:hypothetical protein
VPPKHSSGLHHQEPPTTTAGRTGSQSSKRRIQPPQTHIETGRRNKTTTDLEEGAKRIKTSENHRNKTAADLEEGWCGLQRVNHHRHLALHFEKKKIWIKGRKAEFLF